MPCRLGEIAHAQGFACTPALLQSDEGVSAASMDDMGFVNATSIEEIDPEDDWAATATIAEALPGQEPAEQTSEIDEDGTEWERVRLGVILAVVMGRAPCKCVEIVGGRAMQMLEQTAQRCARPQVGSSLRQQTLYARPPRRTAAAFPRAAWPPPASPLPTPPLRRRTTSGTTGMPPTRLTLTPTPRRWLTDQHLPGRAKSW